MNKVCTYIMNYDSDFYAFKLVNELCFSLNARGWLGIDISTK